MKFSFKRILSCVLVGTMTVLSASVMASASNNSTTGEYQDYFNNIKTAQTVYEIPTSAMTTSERQMVTGLQGIVAQTKAQIAVDLPADWKNIMISDYGIKFVTVSDPWKLLAMFKDQVKGIVSFENTDEPDLYPNLGTSYNKACTFASAKAYLPVEKNDLAKAKALGLTVKADAANDQDYYSEIDCFRALKGDLNPKYICKLTNSNIGCRDYAIAVHSVFYYDNYQSELDEIYSWMESKGGECGTVLGWHPDEVAGVAQASKYGVMTIASDYAGNLSVYAGLNKEKLRQKPLISHEQSSTKVQYVTFMCSDGDNVQVHVNSYRTGSFASQNRGTFPFGWSTAPSLFSLAPNIEKWYYKNATYNDDFLAAVSGVGYCNPALLPKKALNEFAKLTSDYMKLNDIGSTVMLMDSPEGQLCSKNPSGITNSLYDITKTMSQYSGIPGGFLYYGSNYCPVSTPGAVFWNYGKPFVAIRETMWTGGSKEDNINQIAYRVNHYTKDATVVEGYTAINVQYWQYGYDEVQELVNKFDKDVVVVSPREFIEIMAKNVKNKTTKLQLEDPVAYDWDSIFDSSILPINWLDMESIHRQAVSSLTSFDFANGLQGWTPHVMGASYDSASLGIDNGKKVYMTDGSKFDSSDSLPNSYLYNKITLPNKSKVTMNITGKYNDSAVRVQVLDKNDKLYTVMDYVVKDGDYATYSVDLSKFKGQTVTVLYEARDSCKIVGSKSSGCGESGIVSKISFE